MKSRIFLILLTIVTLSFAQKDYQQVIFQRGKFNDQVPILNPILFRAYPVAIAPDTFQVYLITDILYDFLQFTRQQDDFLANFSIEANFINTETKLVYTKTWESAFRLNNFEETNSRDQFFFTLDSLQMPAGNYRLKLIYQDLQGKQHADLDLKFVVRNSKSFYAAPPLFLQKNSNHKQLPFIFAQQKPLPLQKQLPFNQEMDILLHVFNRTGEPVKVNALLKAKDSNKIIFSQDSLFPISRKMGSLILKPNLMALEEGTYSLNLSYTANSDTIKQELPVSIIWFQKPRSLYKIDYAIQPLELIVDPETFEQLKSGNDHEEIENFRKFWLTKDPTSETAFNEVMYEFYTRVDSADIRWGGKRWMYGWRKEPGRTFLLYGKPDEVVDNSLNPVNPIMEWTYQLKDRKLIFTFQALYGRKSYELIDQRTEYN
jgi:GWxTD domain-containing protein